MFSYLEATFIYKFSFLNLVHKSLFVKCVLELAPNISLRICDIGEIVSKNPNGISIKLCVGVILPYCICIYYLQSQLDIVISVVCLAPPI